MNPSDDYKLTDLDYLIGDHHLQMIKASLPYLGVPEQKAISLFVKAQELRKTMELFETEEVASMGICFPGPSPGQRLPARPAEGHTSIWESHGAGYN